ncbi:8768_t:CDS:1, partial [Dentiscutata erythropus]
NNIIGLDLSECLRLRKLDCSNNIGLTELNISNCSNLANINIIGCLELCKVICYNISYSPVEIIEQAKMSYCLYHECREVAHYNGYCNMHWKDHCKEEGCNSQIYISKEYYSFHRSICKVLGCSLQTFLNSDCDYHKSVREDELRSIRKEALKRRKKEQLDQRNHRTLIFFLGF